MSTTIINRSKWPDWFVVPVCKWIVRQTGIDWAYTVTLRAEPTRNNGWTNYIQGVGCREIRKPANTYGGRGWHSGQRSWMSRRYRGQIRETRHKTGQVCDAHGPVESFVWLIAHEARHATAENQRKFGGVLGRENRVNGEHDANEWANEVVRRFREWWPSARSRIMADMRERRRRAVLAKVGPSRAERIADARAMLAKWETKAKRAQTFAAKYRRRVAALERAERMAACT